jgi:hypothetical protein
LQRREENRAPLARGPAGEPAVHFACTSVISMATRSSSSSQYPVRTYD